MVPLAPGSIEWPGCHFFEANPWIFGHGLNYVFLDKVGAKLEAITTGASHEDDGNRVDALMRTRAAISQYVVIEIKTGQHQAAEPRDGRVESRTSWAEIAER